MLLPEPYPDIIAGVVGIIFFVMDVLPRKRRIHSSLIAGIAISYFFLMVLPQISGQFPYFQNFWRNFELRAFRLPLAVVTSLEQFECEVGGMV